MMDATLALFYINLAVLATHECDAIRFHEWRIFFFLRPFNDTTAYRIFTAIHIPFFAVMIALANNVTFQVAFDIFLIVHLGLHYLCRNLLSYKFDNIFSNSLIVGGAVSGALHLLLLYLG